MAVAVKKAKLESCKCFSQSGTVLSCNGLPSITSGRCSDDLKSVSVHQVSNRKRPSDKNGCHCEKDRTVGENIEVEKTVIRQKLDSEDYEVCQERRPVLSYKETLHLRKKLIGRATQIHYPDDPLKIVVGKGQYLYDQDGKEFLDCINNVAHVGHCHPHVVKAGQKQMEVLNTNNRFLHDEILYYAKRLTATMPEKLCVCFLVCTGTEANDLALRLARTYTKNYDAVVLDRAYHGHSVAVMDLSPYKFKQPGGDGKKDYIHVVPCPDHYRGIKRGKNDEELGQFYADQVKQTIDSAHENGRKIAIFYAESLQSCGGQIIHPPGYLQKVYEHVRAAGGVCVADEVQVGFGRVGKAFWGFQLHDVVPDIVTVGKPMGNGHPISAVITTQEIADAFENTGVAYFNTFGGNPVSCAIANAVLDVIEDEGLQARALELGDFWVSELLKIKEKYSLIGDIRGVGLFIGIELVKDRQTREPASEKALEVIYRMKQKGVLISRDGPDNNVLKIKPPMVIRKEDIIHCNQTLDEVLSEISL